MKDHQIAKGRELKVGAVLVALFSLLVTLTGLSAVFESPAARAANGDLGETVEFTPNYDFADIPAGSGFYPDKGNIIWAGNGGDDNGVTNKKSNVGFAWCIDLGLKTPADAKNLIWDKATAQKLTPANIGDASQDTQHPQERYNAAYLMINKMIDSWKAGKYDDAGRYGLYAQALLGTPTAQSVAGQAINGNANDQLGKYVGVSAADFTELTGFVPSTGGASTFDHAIDYKAPEGSYITYVPPTLPNGKVAVNRAQRMVPPDQPGFPPETTPKNPVIKTKASLDGDQVKAGAKVV
ncbi:hypothetical protein, partial [Winkia neuii]